MLLFSWHQYSISNHVSDLELVFDQTSLRLITPTKYIDTVAYLFFFTMNGNAIV